MDKIKLQDQAVPGSIGTAMSVIWVTYAEWMGMIPPNLTDVKEIGLTAAFAVFATGLVNLVRSLMTAPNGRE